MIAASIFDHPAILILIAVVTLIRWLVEKAKASSQKTQSPPPTPNTPVPRGSETQTEEERIRRFMDALGQKPGSRPPPKVTVQRRSVTPRIFPNLPPLKTKPPPLPPEAETFPSPPPPLPAEVALQRSPSRPEPNFEVRDVVRQTSSEPARAAQPIAARFSGRVKLGTPQDLRTAIVLREIFGPPRSLQGFDLTGGL